jgi:DNA primase catalytic core
MATELEQVKAQVDIVQYIGQFVDLKASGRNYKACCPFHDDKTPSFVVNPERQTWRCFGACSEGGDLLDFRMKRDNLDFMGALDAFCDELGIARRQWDVREPHRYGLLKEAAEIYHEYLMRDDDAQIARDYLQARDIHGEDAKRHQLGFAPDDWQFLTQKLLELGFTEDDCLKAGVTSKSEQGRLYDRFRNRVMFPIQDERGRVVGFGARALSEDDQPKYLNSPQSEIFDKSKLLYGLHAAQEAIRETRMVVIVEGYTDVIAAHGVGQTNVVAQMGTALTRHHVDKIDRLNPSDVVVALDGDEAGQNATMKSLTHLARTVMRDIRVMQLPEGRDPDEILRSDPHEWERLVDTAIPSGEFMVNMILREVPEGAGIHERIAIAKKHLPTLAGTQLNLRDFVAMHHVTQLAMGLGLDVDELIRQARGLAETPRPRILDVDNQPERRKVPMGDLAALVTMMRDITLYYKTIRLFREELLEPPNRDDWGQLAREWDLFMESLNQDEVDFYEYVRVRTDLDLTIHELAQVPSEWGLAQACLLMRMRRLDEQLKDADPNDLDMVMKIIDLQGEVQVVLWRISDKMPRKGYRLPKKRVR